MNTRFPAKLLLFGEYTVLNGSRALAVPLTKWSGHLDISRGSMGQELLSLAQYISSQRIFPEQASEDFIQAAQNGLQFISDIPQGYGAGSSGALCAAVYQEFFATDDCDLNTIRVQLAAMESFYHGTSSGMDPLVSYMQQPVLKEGTTYYCHERIPAADDLRIFLIDSGTVRSTGHLVPDYLKKSADTVYFREMIRPLIESSDHAISFLLDNYTPLLWEHLQLISKIQYEVFRPMITAPVLPLWETAMDTADVIIKLCGAGGGGFYLAFVRGDAKMDFLHSFPLIAV